jgi:hypothetical protein
MSEASSDSALGVEGAFSRYGKEKTMEENLIAATGDAAEEVEPELDELDIEAFAGVECKPRAKRYIVRIDKKPYVIEKSLIAARELLVLAGKNPPERFRIWQVIRGESHELTLDQKVDVRAAGVEKFRTLSRTQTEG